MAKSRQKLQEQIALLKKEVKTLDKEHRIKEKALERVTKIKDKQQEKLQNLENDLQDLDDQEGID
jgi:hypothetical protein